MYKTKTNFEFLYRLGKKSTQLELILYYNTPLSRRWPENIEPF